MQIEPDATGHMTPAGDVHIEVAKVSPADAAAAKQEHDVELDPVQLAIFSHR